MVAATGAVTGVLLGRKNYQGFAGYWPAVADDDADPSAVRRWLDRLLVVAD